MTHDSLADYPQRSLDDRPMTHRWSLWSRTDERPDHWRLEMLHRRERCEEIAGMLADPQPHNGLMPWDEDAKTAPAIYQDDEAETLVLPPGEVPLI